MARRNRMVQGTSVDNEVHMMETDIMRFLAIIALCLAIVFAIASGKGDAKNNVDLKAIAKQKKIGKNKITPPQSVIFKQNKVNFKPNETPVNITEPAKKKTPLPEKKGFQLSFKSDAVFVELIQQQKIQLFKLVNNEAYRWQHGWLKVEQPLKYYQLHRDTLPSVYQNHLQKSDKVAVTLPENTERQLQQFVVKHDTGLLIIGDKANVLRKPIL